MAKVKTERPKRAKQGHLPDMEPPKIAAVDSAADYYYEVMMDRTALSKKEHEAKDALIDEMHKAGVTRYETPEGLEITLVSKSNVACKKKKETTTEEDNSDFKE